MIIKALLIRVILSQPRVNTSLIKVFAGGKPWHQIFFRQSHETCYMNCVYQDHHKVFGVMCSKFDIRFEKQPPEVSYKKGVLKIFAEACSFFKKDTPTQIFSCEFREIFKSTFFTEHLQTTSFGFNIYVAKYVIFIQR